MFLQLKQRLTLLICLVFLSALPFNSSGGASIKEGHQEKIDFLLQSIEKSQAIFIRNGKEYSSKKARDHLEQKLNIAKSNPFIWGTYTVHDFIKKIASQSSMSGKPYLMKFPDQSPVKCKIWLLQKLEEYGPKSKTSQ